MLRYTSITIILTILYATQQLKFTLMPWHNLLLLWSTAVCYAVFLIQGLPPCPAHMHCAHSPAPHSSHPASGLHNMEEQNSHVQFKWHVQKKEIWCSRQFVLYIYPSNSAIIKCTWNCAMIVTCYTDIGNMFHHSSPWWCSLFCHQLLSYNFLKIHTHRLSQELLQIYLKNLVLTTCL